MHKWKSWGDQEIFWFEQHKQSAIVPLYWNGADIPAGNILKTLRHCRLSKICHEISSEETFQWKNKQVSPLRELPSDTGVTFHSFLVGVKKQKEQEVQTKQDFITKTAKESRSNQIKKWGTKTTSARKPREKSETRNIQKDMKLLSNKEQKAASHISTQHHTSKNTKPQETLVIIHQQPDTKWHADTVYSCVHRWGEKTKQGGLTGRQCETVTRGDQKTILILIHITLSNLLKLSKATPPVWNRKGIVFLCKSLPCYFESRMFGYYCLSLLLVWSILFVPSLEHIMRWNLTKEVNLNKSYNLILFCKLKTTHSHLMQSWRHDWIVHYTIGHSCKAVVWSVKGANESHACDVHFTQLCHPQC